MQEVNQTDPLEGSIAREIIETVAFARNRKTINLLRRALREHTKHWAETDRIKAFRNFNAKVKL